MEEDNTADVGTSEVKIVKKKSKVDNKNDKVATSTRTKQKVTMIEEVCEAIELLGIPKKGASAQAIKKYVLSKHEESERERINSRINKAFVAGIQNGILTRPTISKDSVGATGRFLLNKKTDKQKVSKKSDDKEDKTKERLLDSETLTKSRKNTRKIDMVDAVVENTEKIKPKPSVAKTKSKPLKVPTKNPKNERKARAEREEERKDLSDSEVVIKKKDRKSLKSYSSDSELNDFLEEKKTLRNRVGKKLVVQDTDPENRIVKSEQSSDTSKAKGKKLNSSSEEKLGKGERKIKVGKTGSKKAT